MRFYFLSPKNVPENPHLFPTMRPTFLAQGHEIVYNIVEADCVMFDLHSRLSDYEVGDINWILNSNIFVATTCEWDRGNMSSDVWPFPLSDQQERVFLSIEMNKRKSVHFCRLLDKAANRIENLYPYEKPILYQQLPVTENDLFNREFDIVWIANDSPSRQEIKKALEQDGRLKCNIRLGEQKIPFKEWIDEHKKGKFFISAGAGGFTDERCQHLFSVAAILRENSEQLLFKDYTHFRNCLRFDCPPTKKDIDTIVEVAKSKEMLHYIYNSGYNYMTMYYSPEFIANDILNKILNHYA